MGCWISSPKRIREPKEITFDGAYVAVTPPTRGLSKKLWRSRNSYASSSGISSGCNTPIRGSKEYSSRCSSPESPTQTPLKDLTQRPNVHKELIYENLPPFLRNVPLDIDLDEDQKDIEVAKHVYVDAMLDESGGYYTEESSDCSTPLASGVVCTQSGSEDLNSTSSESELDMEMYMMNKACGIMPKTSSPVFQRRDTTFNIPTDFNTELPISSVSYQKWRKYLQMTPTYALHNITRIPEAIAGRFCPAEFPGYTETRTLLKELISKRHRRNLYHETAENIAETIIMELPVPTISTEL